MHQSSNAFFCTAFLVTAYRCPSNNRHDYAGIITCLSDWVTIV